MGWYAGRYMPAGDRSASLASPVFATPAGRFFKRHLS
jgi:hypothetical protein